MEWLGEPYEVIAEGGSGAEKQWTLRPWPDPEVMRTAFRLDEAWVEACAVADKQHRRGRVIRWLSIPAAPLLAMAPARLQRQWQDSWGFPAAAATLVSAALEFAAGGVGVVQLLAITFGADWFLTGPLRLVAVIGPALSAEGLVRLATAAANPRTAKVAKRWRWYQDRIARSRGMGMMSCGTSPRSLNNTQENQRAAPRPIQKSSSAMISTLLSPNTVAHISQTLLD